MAENRAEHIFPFTATEIETRLKKVSTLESNVSTLTSNESEATEVLPLLVLILTDALGGYSLIS